MHLNNDAAFAALAMATSQEIVRFELYEVKVYQEELPVSGDNDAPQEPRMMAYVRCQCTNRVGVKINHSFAFPVISVWVDPYNEDACKLHMLMKHGVDANTNLEQVRLQRDLIACIKRDGPLIFARVSKARMILSCDTTGTILRFGVHAESYANQTSRTDWSKVPIFDSKAKALETLLAGVSKTVTLAGLDLINLAAVDDQFMEAMGFVEIPDVCGRGVSMWQGQIEKIANAGDRTYGSYTGGSSYSYSRERKGTNADSFINTLQKALESAV